MTLHEHAAAISAAIKAAAADGFELDNGDGEYVYLDLNRLDGDCLSSEYAEVEIPTFTY